MHSLFFKVFIWFWLTMLAIGGLLFAAQRYWDEDRELPSRGELQAYAGEIARLHRTEGPRAATAYLIALTQETGIGLMVVDAHGRDLRGQPLPPPMARVRDRVLAAARAGEKSGHWFRTWRLSLDGRPHLLLAWRPRSPRWDRELPSWVRPAVALSVTALVSLLLAAHLSRPIRRVRAAARRMGQGELDTRVPVPTGWRRHDELARLGHDFNAMAARIQQLIEAQSRLLRDVSHELRSPLARLQVALGLLRQRRAQQNDDEDMERMELEIERLDALIGQVLSLSRMEAGAVQLARTPVDLAALLEEIALDADFEARAANKCVRFEPHPEVVVAIDAGLIRSAVENVVRNAVRATAESTSVDMVLEVGHGEISIGVRDHGPGVPAEQLDRLFQPFFRVAEARERQSGGYGLGLAIAERAIALHGGRIAASNASGGGLWVTITLPRVEFP